MKQQTINKMVRAHLLALKRIAASLEVIVDRKKRMLRMVDVDRGKVYKAHLGRKLT